MTGLGRIIRLAWEHVCPYEIYWGIVEDTETRSWDQRKVLPGTLLSAITHTPSKTSSVLSKKALWPRWMD